MALCPVSLALHFVSKVHATGSPSEDLLKHKGQNEQLPKTEWECLHERDV